MFQVSVPSTGQLALDLMCGEYGASRCSSKKWFHYMGDMDTNPYVPFQINYVTDGLNSVTKGFKPLDPKTVPCSSPLNVSIGGFIEDYLKVDSLGYRYASCPIRLKKY